ncbi:hypothetical protein JTB14_038138 [Gonioctena quinquepunctata]|nr:hypothetical protein JTB14_038138 [Gonioctena quinquepunctata]
MEALGKHIRRTSKKAEERVAALGRIMPNIGGPMYDKRKALQGMVRSILLYGAPIWYKDMRVISYKNRIKRADRKRLLRLASAYRTASTDTLTGHGCFKNCLKRIRKADDEYCVYCQDTDDVRHTLFSCPRWTVHRLTSSEEEEDTTECLFCTETNSGEGWIKCCVCQKWGHEAWAWIDSNDPDEFTRKKPLRIFKD